MNNKFRICLTTLLIIIITGTWGSVAKATSPNVELEGNAKGIVFINGEDPFLMKHEMMPGDTVERSMNLVNRYNDGYDIYLRARRISPKEDADLLSKIYLTISYGDEVIFKGPVSGEDDLKHDIFLGEIKPGESKMLKAKATFDGKTMGNEFKNKYGAVEWIFTAVRAIEPRTGGPEEEVTIPNSNPPEKAVEPPTDKPNVPQTKKPEVPTTNVTPPTETETPTIKTEVPKKDVPEKIVNREETPKTGDDGIKTIVIVAMIAILLEVFVVYYGKRKKSLEKEDWSNEK